MSHFYTRTGEAMHYVPKASSKTGEMRETTVRDARKLNLFPSVTTMTKLLAAPGLDGWKKEQVIKALLNRADEDISRGRELLLAGDMKDFRGWMSGVVAASEDETKAKAEEGSEIHDSLEKFMKEPDQVPAHHLAYVEGAQKLLVETFGENRVWRSEESFVHPTGFGGKIDLESNEVGLVEPELEIILDFKSKDFGPGQDVKKLIYDDHPIQLGGYAVGREKRKARCFNLFVSTTTPGLSLIYEHPRDMIAWGIEVFERIRDLWQAKNEYRPNW